MPHPHRAPLKPFSRGRSIRMKLVRERPELPAGPHGRRLLNMLRVVERVVRMYSRKFWSKEAMRKAGMKIV